MFHSAGQMNETIQWPSGEFTLPAAVALNRALSEATVRKQLATALAAKTMIQTRKGDGKTPGTFQVVKPAGEN
jgi:adenosylcobinamide amidohydrolase